MRKLMIAILLLSLAASPAAPDVTTTGAGSFGRVNVSVNTRVTNIGDIRVTNTGNTRVTQ